MNHFDVIFYFIIQKFFFSTDMDVGLELFYCYGFSGSESSVYLLDIIGV